MQLLFKWLAHASGLNSGVGLLSLRLGKLAYGLGQKWYACEGLTHQIASAKLIQFYLLRGRGACYLVDVGNDRKLIY